MGSHAATATPVRAVSRGTYFFLSYAHSAPTPPSADTDADYWVGVFYRDLCRHVAELARVTSRLDIGFFDGQLEPGSDWKAALADALAAAEVFVPLLSPAYLNRSWPMSERESFRQRLAALPTAAANRHVIAVLWSPLPSWDRLPECEQALELGAGVAEYAENGLRALCMLSSFRAPYLEMLRRLAGRIVEVAEGTPLGPATPPLPWRTSGPASTDTPFVVAVLAPTGTDLPPNRLGTSYATSGRHWRPFPAQELPVAQSAANVAERLGLPTRIVDFAAGRDLLASSPGVLLIDPWILAGDAGHAALAQLADVRAWVTPVIVVDRGDPQYDERGGDLSDRATDILRHSGVTRVKRVREMAEFVALMPALVAEARRQFLRSAPTYPPSGQPAKRPRLRDPSPPPNAREDTDD